MHRNQVLLSKQVLDHGADVNVRGRKQQAHCARHHKACHSAYATNLDLIELVVDHGADPNAAKDFGETPLQSIISSCYRRSQILVGLYPSCVITKDDSSTLSMVQAN